MAGGRSNSFGEPPGSEAEALRRAFALVRERLPPGWSATLTGETVVADRPVDAVITLTGPDRVTATLVVEARRAVLTRDLEASWKRLRSFVDHVAEPAVPMLTARYLPPPVRVWLEEHGISYADATGNLHVVLGRPAIFLRDRGADTDPWRGPGRPRATLVGPPAARVVRALVDFAPPVAVRELVRRSGASTAATYRVVEFLEGEALIKREPRGPITDVKWRRLIERWSEDYGFQRSNTVGRYLHPRGLGALLEDLAAAPRLRYAITGSLGAQPYAPYAPPRLAMIYVENPEGAAESLGLRPVDTGSNVLLAESKYAAVFQRLVEIEQLRFAAPGQTAVDLLTGPGRSPAEAHALLDWMEAHERVWRR